MRRGFTLVELLVVVGVIALLIAILLPSLSHSRQAARATICTGQLKQLSAALLLYANENGNTFVVSQWSENPGQSLAWDFITTRRDDGTYDVQPGLLWGRSDRADYAQQCPEYVGSSNAPGETFSGFNYNTSYLGGGRGEANPAPARLPHVKSPDATVAFGDGEYRNGANKFMRAPLNVGIDGTAPRDGMITYRAAGTQGFRHAGQTNAAFVDGHVESLENRHTNFHRNGTNPGDPAALNDRVGFLSEDNSLYDLQ